MDAQTSYTSTVVYYPQAVLDNRIEAESVAVDAVSDSPVTDATGIRIVDEAGASGGQALGYTSGSPYAEYEITVPAAGTYDVYVSISGDSPDTILSFGDGTTADLYGSIGGFPYIAGYHEIKFEGALTFSAAGTRTVRISWNEYQVNLDWFSIVAQ
jgi:hypothetical protein